MLRGKYRALAGSSASPPSPLLPCRGPRRRPGGGPRREGTLLLTGVGGRHSPKGSAQLRQPNWPRVPRRQQASLQVARAHRGGGRRPLPRPGRLGSPLSVTAEPPGIGREKLSALLPTWGQVPSDPWPASPRIPQRSRQPLSRSGQPTASRPGGGLASLRRWEGTRLARSCFPLPPSLLGFPPASPRGKEGGREGGGRRVLPVPPPLLEAERGYKSPDWGPAVAAASAGAHAAGRGAQRSAARRTAAEAGQAQATRGSPWATPMRGLSAAALCWSYSSAEGSLCAAGWAGLQRCRSLWRRHKWVRPGGRSEGRPDPPAGQGWTAAPRLRRSAAGRGLLERRQESGSGQPPGGESHPRPRGCPPGAVAPRRAQRWGAPGMGTAAADERFRGAGWGHCPRRPQPLEKLQQAAGSAAEPWGITDRLS